MLLVVDVGNTNTVFGAYVKEELVLSFRVGTDKLRTSDEYGVLIKELIDMNGYRLSDVSDVIISSVVPDVMHALESFSLRYCKSLPIVVGPGVKTGMNIKYENPQEVGADRIVNAVAALNKYRPPLVIIDFGTATTFCAVNRKGEYLGGAISPGIKISSEALFAKASKLPKVEIIEPKTVIGRTTVSSMQSGIFFGYVGFVEHIVKMMKKEVGEDATVVATGGLASLICSDMSIVNYVDKNLTLEGLKVIYLKNAGQALCEKGI